MSEMRREVSRILEDAGITAVQFDKDGAGHQVARFRLNRQEMSFHFPSTGRMNGHGHLNTLARLKRKIREAVPASLRPSPTPAVPVVKATSPAPVRHSLTREEKIHRDFTGGEHPDLICKEYHITRERLYQVVREVNARKQGLSSPPPLLTLRPRPVPEEPAIIRTKKPKPEMVKRNRAIALAFKAGKKMAAIGRDYGLTGARIKQILGELGIST